MMIEAALFGSAVREGELKTAKSGRKYLRLTLRADDGDQAQFVSVLYFGDDAAELAGKIETGARLYVEGSLRLNTWEKDGQPKSGLSVTSWHCCRLAGIGRNRPKRDRRSDGAEKPPATTTPPSSGFFNDDIGF